MVEKIHDVATMIAEARANPEMLGQLLARYRSYLLLRAEHALSPKLAIRSDASDVVQQTCADACRKFAGFRGTTEPEFSAWIVQIHANNLAEAVRKHVQAGKRTLRRERRFPVPDDNASVSWIPAADQSTPSQHIIKGETALRLAEVLESLPEMQRRAVCLRHLEGWHIEEIAMELERSVAAAAGLIKRGLQTLRDRMSEESWS